MQTLEYMNNLNESVVKVSTFNVSNDISISWEWFIKTEHNIRNPMEIHWYFNVRGGPDTDTLQEWVKFSITDIIKWSNSDYTLIVRDFEILWLWKLKRIHTFLYFKILTGLSIQDEEFLRLIRFRQIPTENELAKKAELKEKIKNFQMLKKAEYFELLNKRQDIWWSVDFF